MFEQYLPSVAASYSWFFYLGIILVVSHIILYGIGIDMSYFGIFLIYVGWAKPQLYPWFRGVLWFFILLDIIANARVARNRIFGIKDDYPKETLAKQQKKMFKKKEGEESD
jgi:hypothetical protein